MSIVREFHLVVRGDSQSAYRDALDEALSRIKSGNYSGADSNDEGGFYFHSTNDVAEERWPL